MAQVLDNAYMRDKAIEAARVLSVRHGMDFAAALKITERVWAAARAQILRHVSRGEWEGLSLKDKADVCQSVVKALMDKRGLQQFFS